MALDPTRTTISVQYLKTDKELKAFKRAVKTDADGNKSKWLRQAIHEKLERDGYLSNSLPQGKLVK